MRDSLTMRLLCHSAGFGAAFRARPLFAQTPAAALGRLHRRSDFFIHAFHKDKLGGTLECSLCHVAVKEGSVTLKRPGHDSA